MCYVNNEKRQKRKSERKTPEQLNDDLAKKGKPQERKRIFFNRCIKQSHVYKVTCLQSHVYKVTFDIDSEGGLCAVR